MQKNGISTYSDKKISVGDIRKTQLITTYGVGAIVDFKNDTVVSLLQTIGTIPLMTLMR